MRESESMGVSESVCAFESESESMCIMKVVPSITLVVALHDTLEIHFICLLDMAAQPRYLYYNSNAR
jgi:hypothetical protein